MTEKKDMPVLMKRKINEVYIDKYGKTRKKMPWCKVVWVYETWTIMTSELKKVWANEAVMKERKMKAHWAHQERVTKK